MNFHKHIEALNAVMNNVAINEMLHNESEALANYKRRLELEQEVVTLKQQLQNLQAECLKMHELQTELELQKMQLLKPIADYSVEKQTEQRLESIQKKFGFQLSEVKASQDQDTLLYEVSLVRSH